MDNQRGFNEHKQQEMYMANANFLRWGPTATFVPLARVGLAGVTQTSCFVLGVRQILAFLGNNMLVYPTQNCGVGGLSQRKDPPQMVLRRSGI